jgi:hypothetical protein
MDLRSVGNVTEAQGEKVRIHHHEHRQHANLGGFPLFVSAFGLNSPHAFLPACQLTVVS